MMAMLEADDFVKGLQGIGFDFFTGVPDTILGGIIAHLTEERLYTPAVREDEAVAIAPLHDQLVDQLLGAVRQRTTRFRCRAP